MLGQYPHRANLRRRRAQVARYASRRDRRASSGRGPDPDASVEAPEPRGRQRVRPAERPRPRRPRRARGRTPPMIGLVAAKLSILERHGVGTNGSGRPGQAKVHGHTSAPGSGSSVCRVGANHPRRRARALGDCRVGVIRRRHCDRAPGGDRGDPRLPDRQSVDQSRRGRASRPTARCASVIRRSVTRRRRCLGGRVFGDARGFKLGSECGLVAGSVVSASTLWVPKTRLGR